MAKVALPVAFVLLYFICFKCSEAWYLPGTRPFDYEDGDTVEVQVNVLHSIHTHLPYDYYDLPVCYPKLPARGLPMNLGQTLMGDRIKPSPYEHLEMGTNKTCELVCDPSQMATDEKKKKKLRKLISEDYKVNMMMDNLPLANVHEEIGSYNVGVPLGYTDEKGVPHIYNHLHFIVKYEEVRKKVEAKRENLKAAGNKEAHHVDDVNELERKMRRIISFTATPMSIAHDLTNPEATCGTNFAPTERQYPPQRADADIAYSYGIDWERTTQSFATRWDAYNDTNVRVHWNTIVNSVLIVLILGALVANVILQALRCDLSKFNIERDPEDLDERGWKVIRRDVFRPPTFAPLLAALAGTGFQLLGMVMVVLIVACFGLLSPANRGSLPTTLLVFFAFFGMPAGYTSARLLKMWGRPSWKSIFLTGCLAPGLCFTLFFAINLAVWSTGSSAAVRFAKILAVILLWLCVSLPLVIIGAVWGYRHETIKVPFDVNPIPRHVPPTAWHTNPLYTIPIGGIVPFAAVFLEIVFILGAIWLNRFYDVFGFLLLAFLILIATCAETTVVLIYYQLRAEDHSWWWRAFLTPAFAGGYLFLYSMYFFFTGPLKMKSFVSILLYFGYMGMISALFSVMTGTIGLLASFFFARRIYGSIKVD